MENTERTRTNMTANPFATLPSPTPGQADCGHDHHVTAGDWHVGYTTSSDNDDVRLDAREGEWPYTDRITIDFPYTRGDQASYDAAYRAATTTACRAGALQPYHNWDHGTCTHCGQGLWDKNLTSCNQERN